VSFGIPASQSLASLESALALPADMQSFDSALSNQNIVVKASSAKAIVTINDDQYVALRENLARQYHTGAQPIVLNGNPYYNAGFDLTGKQLFDKMKEKYSSLDDSANLDLDLEQANWFQEASQMPTDHEIVQKLESDVLAVVDRALANDPDLNDIERAALEALQSLLENQVPNLELIQIITELLPESYKNDSEIALLLDPDEVARDDIAYKHIMVHDIMGAIEQQHWNEQEGESGT
jgi:hypothetical protein